MTVKDELIATDDAVDAAIGELIETARRFKSQRDDLLAAAKRGLQELEAWRDDCPGEITSASNAAIGDLAAAIAKAEEHWP